MKILQKIILAVVLFTLFSSCQSGTDVTQVLSRPESRKEIMDSIAVNSAMSQEMMEIIWNSKSGRAMMQGNGKMPGRLMENYEGMMNMIRNNPAMMQNLMSDMMDAAKIDSSMMSSMANVIMRNPQMIDMMKNMHGSNDNMNKMDRLNKMDRMNNGGMSKNKK
jgi:hypothetical protein